MINHNSDGDNTIRDPTTTGGAHLPSGRTVAVPFVLEIRHVLHHPLVDLRQGEPLFRHRADGLRDQVRVRLVAPGVPPAGSLLGSRADRPGHQLLLLLVRLVRLVRRVQPGRRAADAAGRDVDQLRRAAPLRSQLRAAVLHVRPGQRPRVGPSSLQRLQTVIHGDTR